MRRLDAAGLSPSALAQSVADAVKDGQVVIFPTDTVYGIGCDPACAAAVERIFALKNRPRTKPLSLHFDSIDAMLAYAPGNAMAARAAAAFLPGPLTLIVRRPQSVGAYVTAGLPSVGLRVPNHELCRGILRRCGALAATSANYSGEAAFTGAENAAGLPAADLLVYDGATPLGAESSIIDISGETPRLVREGAIAVKMLEAELGPIERPVRGTT